MTEHLCGDCSFSTIISMAYVLSVVSFSHTVRLIPNTYSTPYQVQHLPFDNCAIELPLTEGVHGFMIRFVHELWRDTKAAKYFNRKVAKVSMATKNSADDNQQRSVDGCHNDKGTDPIRPGPIFEASVQSQNIRNGRSNLNTTLKRNKMSGLANQNPASCVN